MAYGLRRDMLSNVLGIQIAAIMFKACNTAAVTNAGGSLPSYEPNAAAGQELLWNLASCISGNFSVKGQRCGGPKWSAHSAAVELTLLPLILL